MAQICEHCHKAKHKRCNWPHHCPNDELLMKIGLVIVFLGIIGMAITALSGCQNNAYIQPGETRHVDAVYTQDYLSQDTSTSEIAHSWDLQHDKITLYGGQVNPRIYKGTWDTSNRFIVTDTGNPVLTWEFRSDTIHLYWWDQASHRSYIKKFW